MFRTPALIALIAFGAVPVAAQQNAQEVLQLVAEKEKARMLGIENYTIIQKVQEGMEAPFYYEAFTPAEGGPRLFRLVPTVEWQSRDPRNQAAGVNTQMAAGVMGFGLAMMAPSIGVKLSNTPGVGMDGAAAAYAAMDGASKFLLAAAYGGGLGDGWADAEALDQGAAMFASRAVLEGRHTVLGGREAYLLVAQASDLPEQQVGEATFAMDKISVWVDTEAFVQLQFRVAGTMKAKGKAVPIKIELNELNHYWLGSMYEPRRQIMSISGLMGGMELDPKQKKKMEKMQADMERMKQQIAAMPPAQRQQFQAQIDRAMRQADLMTNNDVITAAVDFMVYSINEGPPFDWKPFDPSIEPGALPFPTGP